MWTKICGVRDAETAAQIAALKPSAIGLNFYPKSARYVNLAEARRIALTVSGATTLVGVFVNADNAHIRDICGTLGLDHVQLHGDEQPEQLAELHSSLPRLQIIRAFRIGTAGLADVAAYLEACGPLGVPVWRLLLDAQVAGHYGGSGHLAPWDTIRDEYRDTDWPPLILAGGLSADNVRDAIQAVQPWGIDVASGVESAAGIKDLERVAQFLAAAQHA